jgi:rRNA maturation endonuclease Nob1
MNIHGIVDDGSFMCICTDPFQPMAWQHVETKIHTCQFCGAEFLITQATLDNSKAQVMEVDGGYPLS